MCGRHADHYITYPISLGIKILQKIWSRHEKLTEGQSDDIILQVC